MDGRNKKFQLRVSLSKRKKHTNHADENKKKCEYEESDIPRSAFSKPVSISRRKLSDYVPPEEQVILDKVPSEKPYRTPEPTEQEQLEKAIASITGDAPADANDIDASNLAQTAQENWLLNAL